MSTRLFIFAISRIFLLVLAGIVISLMHQWDILVMLILLMCAVFIFVRKRKSKSAKIYLAGFLISAIGGILAENWGIQSGLWTYHDLPNGREFPYWLPFAWGLAFLYLYSFEAQFVKGLRLKTVQSKISLTILVAAILPTVGEIVTVQMGVWTYQGKFKILGIPLYAVALLMLFHTGTFLVLYMLNQRWKIQDGVFARTVV